MLLAGILAGFTFALQPFHAIGHDALHRQESSKEQAALAFQETLFRLLSVMNALLLSCPGNKGRANMEESHTFKVRGWDDLSSDFQMAWSRPYARRSRCFNVSGISL